MPVYPVKFDVPHNGLIWLQYYNKHKVYHPGFDLNKGSGNDDLGAPMKCPVNAEVEFVSPAPTAYNSQNGGFGWFVVLYHPAYGKWTRYAHMNKVSVKEGQKLKAGDLIGEVGNSGTTYAHLHWEGWNPSMYDIQKKHWKKFQHYPSSRPKQYVVEHYFNPLAWVESLMEETALEWCNKHLPEADWKGVKEGEAERFRSLAKQMKKWFT
jgi:murein DD-endopeptidase MepM/ murein hydrolase activator NlpD